MIKLNKTDILNRKRENYNYFKSYCFICPFCQSNTNIELILIHIDTKKCKSIQQSLIVLKGNEIVNKKLEAIKYNRNIIKKDYYNKNEDKENIEKYLILS